MAVTRKQTYEQKLIAEVAVNVARLTKEHVITTVHLDGLHRHWRCAKPGTGIESFHIVTWPGSLCYTGDMGDYLFQRTDDMVKFMRGSVMSHSYAAEKCIANGSPVREWRREVFDELLEETVAEAEDYGRDREEIVRKVELIRDAVGDEHCEHNANLAMSESEIWDGSDFPECEAFSYRFLWCLYAIKWFCDNVKDA